MVSSLFLGMSLVGAEWVLYLLIATSVVSIAVIVERWSFYRKASQGLDTFRTQVRQSIGAGNLPQAMQLAQVRQTSDLESGMIRTLLAQASHSSRQMEELARDEVIRAKILWDRNLTVLATIGANAPFVGLFGTVLGIIKAFHDLSTQGANQATSAVTAGMAEALIATAVGILVAIPAVVAYNSFQRRVKKALAEADALKSFIIGKVGT